MSDIVERLRSKARRDASNPKGRLEWIAADEITALRARIAELEASIADEREDAARGMQDHTAQWLRNDTIRTEAEARRILGNLYELKASDIHDWGKMILMKHGIADAIEKFTPASFRSKP